jgi:hypothetical protein
MLFGLLHEKMRFEIRKGALDKQGNVVRGRQWLIIEQLGNHLIIQTSWQIADKAHNQLRNMC